MHAIKYNPSTATWFLWPPDVMRMHSLEHLVVTSNVEGKRARGRQRLKFLENLHVYMLGGLGIAIPGSRIPGSRDPGPFCQSRNPGIVVA